LSFASRNPGRHLHLVAARAAAGFVDDVRELGTGETRCVPRAIRSRFTPAPSDLAHVDAEDLLATLEVGACPRRFADRSARAAAARIENVGPVRRGEQDHAFIRFEAVHFHEQLVQRLLALVVTAAQPGPRWRPTASISSMKMMQGAWALPWSNRSRTRDAPTPTNISTKSEPDIEKKGRPASPATALASSVFPVPGGPTSSAPFGSRPPRRWNFCGSFRKSMIALGPFGIERSAAGDTPSHVRHVAGCDERKQELEEIIDFLKDPQKIPAPRRPAAEGRAARRASRNREDAARQSGRRRGGPALLLDVGL